MTWTPCYTKPGAEFEVQRDIERAGIGTMLPTYRKVWYRHGLKKTRQRPLFPSYIFAAIPKDWQAEVASIEGVVRVLKPVADEQRLANMALACIAGEFNVLQIQPRARNGQFASGRRRRRRSRPSKRARMRAARTSIMA